MQVREVMTENPACCTRGTKLTEVARIMLDRDCGVVPVVESKDSKKLVGMITDRDIVCRTIAENKNPLEMTVESCMSSPVATATPEESLEECCKRMEENQIRRIAVVDNAGECCGVVAQADIALRGDEKEAAEVVQEVSKPSPAASAR